MHLFRLSFLVLVLSQLTVFGQTPGSLDVSFGSGGIAESSLQQSVKLYPNPTTGTIFLELPDAIASLSITDVHGAMLLQLNNPTSTVELSVPGSAGVYFCRVEAANGEMAVVKVLKQ